MKFATFSTQTLQERGRGFSIFGMRQGRSWLWFIYFSFINDGNQQYVSINFGKEI